MSKSRILKAPGTEHLQGETLRGEIKVDASFDLGNANANAQGDGFSFDTRAIIAPISDSSRLAGLPVEDVYHYGGRMWALGEACYQLEPEAVEENVNDARYLTQWYKRLFAGLLHRSFHALATDNTVIKPRIISSIPAALFKNKGYADKVRAHLLGGYQIGNVHGGTLCVDVQDLKIIPEGIGSYWQRIYAESAAEELAFTQGLWLFADEGHMSLDGVFVRDGVYLASEAKSDTLTGTVSITDAVKEHINAETGISLLRPEVDELMRYDAITVSGIPVEVKAVRDVAAAELARRACGVIEMWARGKNLAGIVLTGGGARYIADFWTSDRLPDPSISASAARDNVEGAYLYLKNI